MPLLTLETSGLQGSIALDVDGHVTERSLATAGRRHAQTLTLEIHELLKEQGVTPRNLNAVAVSLGPGSFTGLRVGLVCAKTLAYALNCRLIGIETYHSIVNCIPDARTPAIGEAHVWTVGDAQRGDLFVAEFVHHSAASGWQRQGEYRILPGEDWLTTLPSSDLVLGPGLSRYRDVTSSATLIDETWSLQPSATALVPLARQRLESRQFDDPWTILPIYLRPSAAEEQRAKTGLPQ